MKQPETPVAEKVAQIYDRLLDMDDELEDNGMTVEIADTMMRIMNLARVYLNRL